MSFFSKASYSCSGGPGKSNFFSSLSCPNYSSSSFWKKFELCLLASQKYLWRTGLSWDKVHACLLFLWPHPFHPMHIVNVTGRQTFKSHYDAYVLCWQIKFFILRHCNSKMGIYHSHVGRTPFFLFFSFKFINRDYRNKQTIYLKTFNGVFYPYMTKFCSFIFHYCYTQGSYIQIGKNCSTLASVYEHSEEILGLQGKYIIQAK